MVSSQPMFSSVRVVWCKHPDYHDDQYAGTRRVISCSATWCTRPDGAECCWCMQLCCSTTIVRCKQCSKPCCVTCYAKYSCDRCEELSYGEHPFLCAYCSPARKAHRWQGKPVFWCEPCIVAQTSFDRLLDACPKGDECDYRSCPTCDDPIEARRCDVCPHTEHYAAGDERCDRCRVAKCSKK
jgi:hypothetical protein